MNGHGDSNSSKGMNNGDKYNHDHYDNHINYDNYSDRNNSSNDNINNKRNNDNNNHHNLDNDSGSKTRESNSSQKGETFFDTDYSRINMGRQIDNSNVNKGIVNNESASKSNDNIHQYDDRNSIRDQFAKTNNNNNGHSNNYNKNGYDDGNNDEQSNNQNYHKGKVKPLIPGTTVDPVDHVNSSSEVSQLYFNLFADQLISHESNTNHHMKHDKSSYGGKAVTASETERKNINRQNNGFRVTEKCLDDDYDTGDVHYASNDHDIDDYNNNNNNNINDNDINNNDINHNNDYDNDETPPLSPSLFNSTDTHNDNDTTSSLPYDSSFPILTVPESIKIDSEHSLSIEYSTKESAVAQNEKNIWDF